MNDETRAFLPKSLIIDIPEVDDQHAALFARLANLKMHCVDVHDLPLGELDELMQTLRAHCATEERLAHEAGLDFSCHALKHEKMLGAIAKAIAEVGEQKTDVFSILRYIEYWFERHIREEDQNLGYRLQQASAGQANAELSFTLVHAAAA